MCQATAALSKKKKRSSFTAGKRLFVYLLNGANGLHRLCAYPVKRTDVVCAVSWELVRHNTTLIKTRLEVDARTRIIIEIHSPVAISSICFEPAIPSFIRTMQMLCHMIMWS